MYRKPQPEKLYEQIDKDLAGAEALLPEQWATEFLGRLTWGAARSLHARTFMMRNNWDSLYIASNDVMTSGLYNLNTPYDKIFTDEGENSGGSIFELQCTATAALPASDVIGSQFCEVQGVRGANQWDLGWGWNMATQELYDAYEPETRAGTLPFFTSAKTRQTRSLPKTPIHLITNHPYRKPWAGHSTKKPIPILLCAVNIPTKVFG